MKKITITKDNEDLRIDKFLRHYFKSLPLSQIFKMLRKKVIKVNGKKVEQNYKLQVDDEVIVHISDERLQEIEKDSTKIRERNTARAKPRFTVLFEDEHLLVVDKPAGIAIHSGTKVGRDTLINQVLTYLKYEPGQFKAAPVNRIDKDTSGIVLFAKSREAVLSMNDVIRKREIKKNYQTLIIGHLDKDSGIIKAKLKRNYSTNSKFKVEKARGDEGQDAVTKYSVAKKFKHYSLLDLDLITGRTHQIRAHLHTIKHPIVGDGTYGDFPLNRKIQKLSGLKRQFLHAVRVQFEHPVTKEKLDIKSPLSKDLQKTLAAIENTHG